jgi:hypothetical protein
MTHLPSFKFSSRCSEGRARDRRVRRTPRGRRSAVPASCEDVPGPTGKLVEPGGPVSRDLAGLVVLAVLAALLAAAAVATLLPPGRSSPPRRPPALRRPSSPYAPRRSTAADQAAVLEVCATSSLPTSPRAVPRSVGIVAAVPLGVCLLPAFMLLGVVPTVASLFGSVAP